MPGLGAKTRRVPEAIGFRHGVAGILVSWGSFALLPQTRTRRGFCAANFPGKQTPATMLGLKTVRTQVGEYFEH